MILSDRKRFDILINRTRLVALGRETSQAMHQGERIHTVPVLLECRNESDKMELEDILRNCQWFNTFHWPVECMPFVKEVRRMGYEDKSHYVRIRPETRDGTLQIRWDVKEKRERRGLGHWRFGTCRQWIGRCGAGTSRGSESR